MLEHNAQDLYAIGNGSGVPMTYTFACAAPTGLDLSFVASVNNGKFDAISFFPLEPSTSIALAASMEPIVVRCGINQRSTPSTTCWHGARQGWLGSPPACQQQSA